MEVGEELQIFCISLWNGCKRKITFDYVVLSESTFLSGGWYLYHIQSLAARGFMKLA